MTPKQKCDERKRLRAERMLREEQRLAGIRDNYENERQNEKDMEERFIRLLSAFERIADVMELWADQQGGAA